ncbi:MAG: putative transposase [Paracoccaceae bacterium]|jgi:putative transposase
MRQSRFTEAQIIGMIKEQEAGTPTAEVCRRHGLSPASFYKFKARYGGMNVSDTHRLKSLEDENGKPDLEATRSDRQLQAQSDRCCKTFEWLLAIQTDCVAMLVLHEHLRRR